MMALLLLPTFTSPCGRGRVLSADGIPPPPTQPCSITEALPERLQKASEGLNGKDISGEKLVSATN